MWSKSVSCAAYSRSGFRDAEALPYFVPPRASASDTASSFQRAGTKRSAPHGPSSFSCSKIHVNSKYYLLDVFYLTPETPTTSTSNLPSAICHPLSNSASTYPSLLRSSSANRHLRHVCSVVLQSVHVTRPCHSLYLPSSFFLKLLHHPPQHRAENKCTLPPPLLDRLK